MRILRLTGLAVSLCLSLGCTPRDFLTRRLAADLISASPAFQEQQVFWLKTDVVSNKVFNSPDLLVLQRRGWIIGTPAACPASVEPPPCWDVVLSPAGVGVFQPLIGGPLPFGKMAEVHVARRELVSITGISKAGSLADVEFLWHWVPLNDVGKALFDSGVNYHATVGFRNYDDGWRVVAGPTRSNQPLEDALHNSQPAQ